MSSEHVLAVEDDKHILKLLKYNLEKAGFVCNTAVSAEQAFEILDSHPVDLIILDVMLPKMDGFEFCKVLRQTKNLSHIPVIMLTARGEEVDKIVGLELGADDYMVKPFSPRELLLRVKAILRRGTATKENPKDILLAGNIQIDIPRHKVTVEKRVVELSPMEFKLLTLLVERKGRVQSRDNLLSDVWGLSSEVTTRTVDTHVKLLRQKLGRHGRLIETVRSLGYKLSDEED